jgi:hypothetical protein
LPRILTPAEGVLRFSVADRRVEIILDAGQQLGASVGGVTDPLKVTVSVFGYEIEVPQAPK